MGLFSNLRRGNNGSATSKLPASRDNVTQPLPSNTPDRGRVATPDLDTQYDHTILIPLIPEMEDVINLLDACGAVGGETVKNGATEKRYRVYVLPDNMRITGQRPSRTEPNEFTDLEGTRSITGYLPAAIYAPDNTLLCTIRLTTSTIGTTWVSTAAALSLATQHPLVLPDHIIFAAGMQPDFPDGELWEKLASGREDTGTFSLKLIAQKEFARATGRQMPGADSDKSTRETFNTAFNEHLDDIRQPLIDIDSARSQLVHAFLNTLDRNTEAPTTSQVTLA